MAVLPIVKVPQPVLREKTKKVKKIDASIQKLIDDMIETMHDAPGVGLAANQVGISLRIAVMQVPGEDVIALINPEIIRRSGTRECEEGCLSLPDQFADVTRPAEVKVRYLDHENEIREIHAKGLLAVCLQHEMDHLEGVLFVDRISVLRRNMILRKLAKLKKQKTAASA